MPSGPAYNRLTWEQETFAYADGWDETRQRYVNLRAGQSITITDSGPA